MTIKLQRGKRQKTEHGYCTFEEMQEVSPCKHCFKAEKGDSKCGCPTCTTPKPKHIITIPLKKHIHPCNKDKIECYDGLYYDTDKKEYINPSDPC